MKEELKKSLTDLIDETLMELEELKKSRFQAAEIEIKGPGDSDLAGKPTNGKLDASKAEDDKKDEDKDEEAEKAEGVNEAVKAEGINEEAAKAEDDKEEKKDEDKKDEPHKDDPKHEEKEKAMAKKLLDMHKAEGEKEMKKSLEASESLMKSYVDEKFNALSSQMASLLESVNKLSDSPVPARGVSYKGVAPLAKSVDESEPLTKSEVASKLFELKKSGAKVDSHDITMAEMGHDLSKIVSKYSIK